MSERKSCVLVADDSPEVRRVLCRYLVAWTLDDGEAYSVLARRVWGNGQMDGSAFELATDETSPDVAYAGGAGMFLVTTDDDDEVYGRRYAIPVADSAGSPLTGTAPLTRIVRSATFSNGSLPLTYTTAYTLRAERPQGEAWTFGDGATSTLTNPVHSYTQTGSFTVTLTTAVVTETDTLTRTSYITVSAGGCVSPTAGFSGSPLTGTAPLTVSFTDASNGTISGWWWSFGDGGSSSETNPGHGYTQTGAYTVSLRVSGACGSDVLTRTNYITVSGGYTATTTTITYTYHPLNRLAEAEYSDGKAFTYAYDAAGNRTAYTETITQTLVTTYTYDAANRLTAVGNVSYTYDNRGNLTHDGTSTYTWNAAGRLVKAESITHTLVYTYNGDGVRVGSAADGTVTRYVQDTIGLPQVLVETTGGATVLYLYGFSRLAQVQGSDAEWFLGDALGSVRQLVDEDGVVVLARDYDPYGQILSVSGTGSSGYGFTGEQYDRYTEFIFLRARWLDPMSGRFSSQDRWTGSIQQPGTLHKYSYALNNPILVQDPSGYQATGILPVLQDKLARIAVQWYRWRYPDSIARHSREYSIQVVELEAGLYTMGGFEGFLFDYWREFPGVRQDLLWEYAAFVLRYGARGFRYPGPDVPVCDDPLARILEDWGERAAVPSLGIAQVDPPTALAIENYWAKHGGSAMSPPVGKPWGEWLINPDVGIRYLAAYVGWSRRELERFTSETGGWFSQEREWWFIGKMINGDNPTRRIDDLTEKSRYEGVSGVISYWASSIAPDNKFQTSARYVRYMKSPLP